METVYCKNCEYGTENDIEGNWIWVCPECNEENTVIQEDN